jgi:DNA primase
MSSPILDLIREKINIVDVVDSYVKDLRRAGRNYKACCPFHHEKTPSFTVSPDKGIFYCFGCNEGGDIFTFVMKMEGITFHEAAKKLALQAGVEYGDRSREFTKEEKERYALKKILSFARQFYSRQLFSPEGEKARLYLGKRKVNKVTAERFELGWAPAHGQTLYNELKKNSFPEALAVKAGLIKKTDSGTIRDVFRGRLLFPIKNQSGDTIAFGGRILDPERMPKYLNSSDSILFSKRKTLYGLNMALPEIRRTGRALILEGYMDVIGAHQHGIGYAVAPLGTAFSQEHAEILGRAAGDIILMFDDDAAGIKASVRAAEIFMQAGLFVRIASLAEGLDPDEFLIKYGRTAFEKLLSQAEDPLEFRIRQFFKNRPSPSVQDKAQAINILLGTVAAQSDEIVKSEWIKLLATRFNVDRESVLRQLEKKNSNLKQKEKGPEKTEKNYRAATLPPLEKDLLQMLIRCPELISQAAELKTEDFSDSLAGSIFLELRNIPEKHRKDAYHMLLEKFPDEASRLYELAVSEPAGEKNDAAAVAGAARMIRAASAKRRMMKLKNLPGMTPEQLQEYSLLAMELKASGGKDSGI